MSVGVADLLIDLLAGPDPDSAYDAHHPGQLQSLLGSCCEVAGYRALEGLKQRLLGIVGDGRAAALDMNASHTGPSRPYHP